MPKAATEATGEASSEVIPEATRSHARGTGQSDGRARPVLKDAVEIRNRGHRCGLQRQMGFQTCKDGTKSQRVRCAQRRGIKSLPTAAMDPNEEPIIESGVILMKVAAAKAQEYSMGRKEQAAQRKMQPTEPTKPASEQQPSGGYEWRRCGAMVEIMSLFR
jgi:hypothetical protein